MTRYNRGGYRNKKKSKMVVGKSRSVSEAHADEMAAHHAEGNIMDGSSIGEQDPSDFPLEDSEAGGPAIIKNSGGDGVPEVGAPTPPENGMVRTMVETPVASDSDLDELEKAADEDPELTPQAPEEEEPTPEPPVEEPTVTDDQLKDALGEEEDDTGAVGEGVTKDDFLPGEDEEPEAEEPEDDSEDDDIQIELAETEVQL
jgi:hypothetical protein